MESIDKFVQYCIKPKTYDTSNGSKYGTGIGSGFAVGYTADDTGFGEDYSESYAVDGSGNACGYGYKDNAGAGNFETDNLYEEHR